MMKFYISDLSLVALAAFYLPLVIWVLWRIWNSGLQRGAKVAALMVAVIVAYAIPMWDVTVNSLAMAKVCPTAGLHIYKTVEVDGLIAGVGADFLERHPYKYAEVKAPGGRWARYERQNNQVATSQIDSPISEYEVGSNGWHLDLERGVDVLRYFIRHRQTKEILADDIKFRSLPSWVDKVFLYSWAGTGGGEFCGSEKAIYTILPKVLVPKPLP